MIDASGTIPLFSTARWCSTFSSLVLQCNGHCACAREQEVWATPCLVVHRTSTARQMHEGPAWWSQGFCMMRIQTAAPARLNTQKAQRCETLWPLGPSCLCLLLSFLIIFISTLSCVMAVNSQYILTKHLFVLTVHICTKPTLCVCMVYFAWCVWSILLGGFNGTDSL